MGRIIGTILCSRMRIRPAYGHELTFAEDEREARSRAPESSSLRGAAPQRAMWQDCAVADGGMRRNAAIEPNHHRRRLWLSLGLTGAGVIGVVAVGVIVGILKSGSPGGGVAHAVVTPAALGPYKWAPDLDSVAMCAWFDNDSFGILTSPTLNAANLANLMVQDRALIELVKK